MGIDVIIARLVKAKPVADGWIACCPAHDDRQPSLTITEKSDGRILMHCFAGCATEAVMAAIGLELTDLFPEPLSHHLAPVPARLRFPAAAVLECVAKEALIVRIAAADVGAGRALSTSDKARLSVSTQRLTEAVEIINGL